MTNRPHFVTYDTDADEHYSCDACLYHGTEPPPLPCVPDLGLHGDLALHNHYIDRAKADYGNAEETP